VTKHTDFQTDFKKYIPGPSTLGIEVNGIVKEVLEFINNCLRKAPQARISLVGHSRGGLIAVLAAEEFKRSIHFLGLYDAVDRHMGRGAKWIPGNVLTVYHARRDPSVQSRVYFGNTATHWDPAKTSYLWKYFRATHGGIGGDPHGGENEQVDNAILTGLATVAGGPAQGLQTWQSIACTIDLATDIREGKGADRFIRDGARDAGLPIS
jgi:pimeloyl-ACP methyl ester carboxylesterase